MWRLALWAALLAAGAGGGYWVRDDAAVKADLKRERAEAIALNKAQERNYEAGQETERKLTAARRDAAVARADADGVRDLAGRITASAQASERDRERIRILGQLAAESAGLLEQGEELVGRLDARLTGCQATP